MDTQGYRFPVLVPGYRTSVGAANEDIEFDPIPPGRLQVITNLAMENLTTNFTSLRIIIRGGGQDVVVMEDLSCIANRLYWHDGELFIPEDHYLVLRFTGTTNLDELRGYIVGYQVIQPEPMHQGY